MGDLAAVSPHWDASGGGADEIADPVGFRGSTLMLLSDDITVEHVVGVGESQKLDYCHLLP